MDKVLKFLERHCQWFAIGLGVIFLGYMVWSYTPMSPTPVLAVKISGHAQPVLPGHIDETVAAEASNLDRDMAAPNEHFKIDVPDVKDAWVKHNELAEVPVKQLDSPWDFPGSGVSADQSNTQLAMQNQRITKLPDLPAAVPDVPNSVNFVRTMVNKPATGAAGAAGAPPAPGIDTDVDVVNVLFTIPHTDLANAFNKAFGVVAGNQNLQQQINESIVMSVDLVREEQLPGNVWGNQTVIATLPIHNIPPLPPQQNPTLAAETDFMSWLTQHNEDVLEPSYYETDKGMPVIYSPDQPPPPDQQTPIAPAPPIVPPQPRFPQPPYNNYPNSHQPNGTQRRTGRGGSGASFLPDQSPKVITVQFNNVTPPGGAGMPGMSGGPGGLGAAAQVPGLDANKINGKFDVTKLGVDIRILGHDDTVVPGRTYRYMVRYTMYNSIFGFQGALAQPANLTQQLYMVSPLSAPTTAITVPPRLRFFLASIFRNGVVFDVFTWKDGKWSKSRSPTIFPGDAIESTDWSVLDIRQDVHGNGGKYTLLIKTDGTIERHESDQERKDPDYQNLQNQVNQPATPAAQANSPRPPMQIP